MFLILEFGFSPLISFASIMGLLETAGSIPVMVTLKFELVFGGVSFNLRRFLTVTEGDLGIKIALRSEGFNQQQINPRLCCTPSRTL